VDTLIIAATVGISLLLFAQSLSSLGFMLHIWENPRRMQTNQAPSPFLPPQLSFSVLLPARHEERVIYQTIERVWKAHYPSTLLEIIVICHLDDAKTIAMAEQAIRDLHPGTDQIRVATFSQGPVNKPHGLNVGLRKATNQVVAVFDAEDDIDPDIFNVINTIILNEQVGIIQAGVQLMNFSDHWFSIHNCREYFFWFKSRLHFHARAGMIPLGGNTIFIHRTLLGHVGGRDEQCLTEDADIGLRLSALGKAMRVIYDARHATREETPATVASFVRQRTRWQQGYLQVLKKGIWRKLPKLSQRVLALYTFSYPYIQAMLFFLWPFTLATLFSLKLPVAVTMLAFLPLYTFWLQFLTTVAGAFMFTREYKLKFHLWHLLMLIITFIPFQMLLSMSAVRGLYRELLKKNDWEKTFHAGAHRECVPVAKRKRCLCSSCSAFQLRPMVSTCSTFLTLRMMKEPISHKRGRSFLRDGSPTIRTGTTIPLLAGSRLPSGQF
jgi:cellulose synthase/poly-beta-1,6-N-acetylglucosamine synthase-like glycosyltransferase